MFQRALSEPLIMSSSNHILDRAAKLAQKFQVNNALILKQAKRNPSELYMSKTYENEVVAYTKE